MREIEVHVEIGEFEFGNPQKGDLVTESFMDLFSKVANQAEERRGDRTAIGVVAQIIARGDLVGGLRLEELVALQRVFDDANFTFEWKVINLDSSNSSG